MSSRLLHARAAPVTARNSVPQVVSRVVAEPGGPLPQFVLAAMGSEFNHDFSSVRVHTDNRAAASARAVGATAYTVGRHIAFDLGRYDPVGAAGRRLLRHELVHTMQQVGQTASSTDQVEVGAEHDALEHEAAAADVAHRSTLRAHRLLLQRQSAPGPAQGNDAELDAAVDAALTEYEKAAGQPPAPWLKAWAQNYALARREVPEAPPLTGSVLLSAADHRRVWGKEPPIPHPAQPKRLPAGGIAVTDLLPFANKKRVLITDLLRDLLKRESTLIGVARATGNLDPEAETLLDVLLDPKTPLSLEADVLESTPMTFRASVSVPALPTKGMEARKIAVTLEATDIASEFDLKLDWGTGRQVFVLKARRSNRKIVTSTTIKGVTAEISLARTPTGGVVAEAALPQEAKGLLGVSSLKLVSIEPLSHEAGTPEAAKERTTTEKVAISSATVPPRQEVSAGGGVRFDPLTPALSVGWRFNFRVVGDVVGVPVGVRLDYVPRLQMATMGVGVGGEFRFPAAGVPMALSVVGAAKIGAGGLGSDQPAAVLGPSVGARALVNVRPTVGVYLGYDYFRNLLTTAAEKKGIESVSTIEVGAALRF